MRGRKPLPSNIVDLRGGSKHMHRETNKSEPKPALVSPPCPQHLNTEARKEWRRMAKELSDLGLLTRLDKTVFAIYCSSWSTWKEASEKLAKSGLLLRPASGNRDGKPFIVNDLLRVQREAENQMLKCLVEMGMSPSSRSRIKVPPPKEKNPFEEFLNG